MGQKKAHRITEDISNISVSVLGWVFTGVCYSIQNKQQHKQTHGDQL